MPKLVKKKSLKLLAILFESVILFPSESLKKSGKSVGLFLPSTLFRVFHVSFMLNLFNISSAVILDFCI